MGALVEWGLLEIGLVATFLFCWCAIVLWRHSGSPTLQFFGHLGISALGGRIDVHPFTFLVKTDDAITAWLERHEREAERGIVYTFNQLIDAVAVLLAIPVLLGLGLYELSKWVGDELGAAVSHVDVGTITKPIYRAIAAVRASVVRDFRAFTRELHALEAKVAHVAHVAAGAVAAPWPRIGSLERTAKAQGKRLTALEKIALGGLAVAGVWAALRKMGLGWLRCSNVKKTGKAVCGMDPSLLESLLLDVAVIGFAFNIREFARELEAITSDVAGLIEHFAGDAANAEIAKIQLPL